MFGSQCLLLDVYRGILKMAGECFELIAFWQSWNGLGVRVVLWGYLEREGVSDMDSSRSECQDGSRT
jgi:hypothetical protein